MVFSQGINYNNVTQPNTIGFYLKKKILIQGATTKEIYKGYGYGV